jgi:hypothetical protein
MCPSPPIAWAPPATATESVARLSSSVSYALTGARCVAERREAEHREVERRARIAAPRATRLERSDLPLERTASAAAHPSAPPPNPFETPPPNPFE